MAGAVCFPKVCGEERDARTDRGEAAATRAPDHPQKPWWAAMVTAKSAATLSPPSTLVPKLGPLNNGTGEAELHIPIPNAHCEIL